MAQIVFRSKHAAYRIHFDPKRFGMMDSPEDGDYLTDANGNVVSVPTTDPNDAAKTISVPVRRKIAKPAAQFHDSMLVLDDAFPMQRAMIEDLRKVIDGRVKDNQGRKFCRSDELWEEDPHTTEIINQLNGAIIVTLPEVFDAEDVALLGELEKYFHNAIPRPALHSATSMFERALERFHVRGLASPVPERAVKQLRPRIIDLVYAINDAAAALKMDVPFSIEPQTRGGAEPVGDQPSA